MNIAIRADGGQSIGMGHIMRCIALAQALQDKGCNIYFIAQPNDAVLNAIETYLNDARYIGIEKYNDLFEELDQIKDVASRYGIDALVVDHYKAGQNYLVEAKKEFVKLISIDDLNPFAFPSDIVINGNIYAPKLNYRSLCGNTKFLLGPRYIPMRKEFQNLPKRYVKDKVERILVTIGGSDAMGLTDKIVHVLDCLDKITIDVIMGAASRKNQTLEALSKEFSNIHLYSNVNNIVDLMIKADIAVSAAGSTLYELAACGVPTIALVQADNQVLNANAMEEEGCAINLGWGNKISDDQMFAAVAKLINDKSKRQCMATKGQMLVDGFGAVRCAEAIMK